jgi:hypothetical protein
MSLTRDMGRDRIFQPPSPLLGGLWVTLLGAQIESWDSWESPLFHAPLETWQVEDPFAEVLLRTWYAGDPFPVPKQGHPRFPSIS